MYFLIFFLLCGVHTLFCMDDSLKQNSKIIPSDQWNVIIKDDQGLYSIVELIGPDKGQSFRLLPFSKIDEASGYYFSVNGKKSYIEILFDDYTRIAGADCKERLCRLASMTMEALEINLTCERKIIALYKDLLLERNETSCTEDLVELSNKLYQIRNNPDRRPNPFLAELYMQELLRRQSMVED